ncbi:hypothetical protein [Phytoactinopolyspora mesophila]|uniref:Uncharacterized protein n=1 Tax=Phytoactinopolyspora mesophila TaxID=2650750 RepID=A0A7K3M801_9ACTN|nr:hypothetical protein [Phytoactinopolyspora mesophila]NDL59459.1 hypothetical protein [Phytoactinopolyspora mesophila]
MSTGQARAHGDPPRPPVLTVAARTAVSDLFAVFTRAGRLLIRHWPVVLAILFAGEAARYAAIWAAVELSDLSGTLGVLVLAFAPLAAASALIGALYSIRHSLPSLSAATSGARGTAGIAALTGSVLVPFLAIYASYGFLDEDVFRFVNTAVADELFDVDVLLGTGTIDPNRTALATGRVAVLLVLIALTLRFALEALGRRRHVRGLVWMAAYVEALWLITLARMLSAHAGTVVGQIKELPAVQVIADLWHPLLAAAGPLADVFRQIAEVVPPLLGSADTLIVVPLAWLALGAIVYESFLDEPQRRGAAHRAPPRRHLASRMPPPIRAVGRELNSGLSQRFGEISTGLRRLAMAGLPPVLLFAIVFIAAQRLEQVLNLAWRQILGPMPLDTALAFAPHTSMVSHAVGTVVVVCLLGAAIDRFLGRGQAAAGTGHDATRNAR